MAAARDQAARILRAEPDAAEGAFAREVLVDSPRSPLSEETVARRSAEVPGNPATEKPATAPPAADAAAPKSGKRKKMILMGVGALRAATIGAFIYNLTTDLIGGVEVTLADRD